MSSLQLLMARKSEVMGFRRGLADLVAMVGATFVSRAAGFNQWSYGISFSGGSSGIAVVANTHRSVHTAGLVRVLTVRAPPW